MDGLQLAVPVAVIAVAAAVTFYAVSFAELREKSFQDLEDKESTDEGGLQRMNSPRERRRGRMNRSSRAQKPTTK